ncbi:MAG: NAD-dependent epimerase/dehydratase family protein [Candidatus Heimdallarchaeaceae archaeon]
MKVLLTGSFGNVGKNALLELVKKGYKVRAFDVKTQRNVEVGRKIFRQLKKENKSFEVVWGDIRDKEVVEKIVKGVDTIVHLAAIIPPLAYEKTDFAFSVNVLGSKSLIESAEKEQERNNKNIQFIYASSIAVHGNRMKYPPPTKVTDPLEPLNYDNYASHKITVENILLESKLNWTILRFGVVTPFEISFKIPPIMFEIPLTQRIEVVDTRDVGLACANAVGNEEAIGEIFFIGGGEGNRMIQSEYIRGMLGAMGIGMLPEEAFKPIKSEDDYYHCDWMDTEEAQRVLKFQRFNFEDFLKEFKRKRMLMRMLIIPFRPIARAVLLSKSPYYNKDKTFKQLKTKRKIKEQKVTVPT